MINIQSISPKTSGEIAHQRMYLKKLTWDNYPICLLYCSIPVFFIDSKLFSCPILLLFCIYLANVFRIISDLSLDASMNKHLL